jgi:hypothetical protein
VDVAFDDEHTPGNRKSRTPAFEIADVASQCLPIAERQTSWLERSASQGGEPTAWRPIQQYRLGGKHWCQALDNQFLHSSSCGGLSYFRFDSERNGLWSSWRTFPYLAVSMDLGPKGLCGFNALERLFALNIDKWPDWSHGVSRDFWLSVSALGLKGF